MLETPRLDSEMEDMLAACSESTAACAKIFFPERFYRPFSSNHQRIFDLIDDPKLQLIAIAAHRGAGKSSIVNLALPARHILFQHTDLIVPISCSASQAILHSENLKRELIGNEMVLKLFGSVRSKDSFSKEQWITEGSNIMVFPRGGGQQIRGTIHKNRRPGLIILDDIEDPEAVKSEERRATLKSWLFEDVINSVNQDLKDWKIIVIGTILHEDSLLQNLLDSPAWTSETISLCDENFNPYWPDFLGKEAIVKMVEIFRADGKIDSFYREYMNLPVATEHRKFTSDMFKYYDEKDLSKRNLLSVVLVDPAKTAKEESCDTAIVGIGVDMLRGTLYIRDIEYGRFHPQEQIDIAIKMSGRLGATALAVEVTSLNEFVTFPFKQALLNSKVRADLIELHAVGKKEDRIAGLIPLYRTGRVYHNKSCCEPLEQQLLSFPRSKRSDIMDAAAYIIKVLDIGDMFFAPETYEMKDGKTEEEVLKAMEREDLDIDYSEDEDFTVPVKGWRMMDSLM